MAEENYRLNQVKDRLVFELLREKEDLENIR